MLKALHIHNIALIDQASLAFQSGLCVLTGETGAGKSILLDALGLALGNRNDPRLLRAGTAQGSVAAEFSEYPVELLTERGLPLEETLILRRVITPDGKSRAFVNDAPVSVSLLKEIGEELVEIHGQHDQRKLFSPAAQREILDNIAGLGPKLSVLQQFYKQWQQALANLAETEEQLKNTHGETDYLTHAAAELGKLSPKPGEESLLAEQRQSLMQKEKSVTTLSDALSGIAEKPDVSAALYNASRLLQRNAPHFNTLIDALEKAANETSDAQALLEKALSGARDGDANIDQVEERLFSLRAAARKYHCTPDELPAELARMQERLSLIADHQKRLQALRDQIVSSKAAYEKAANLISEARNTAARKLEKSIAGELKPLKMEHAVFKIHFETLPEAQWGPSGIDQVTFMIQPNKGGGMEPLHKIASGGELSRIMLALKCVSADTASMTMIFDEVDTGVSGAVAEAVGKRLHRLGTHALVLVVTHLPQVAAFGRTHLRVAKSVKGNETFTRIELLEGEARQDEIARMLAGSEITAEARAAASKLLESAA